MARGQDLEAWSGFMWVGVISTFNKVPVTGLLAWSEDNLLAMSLEDAVMVVDVEAALESSWEPKVVTRITLPDLQPETPDPTSLRAIAANLRAQVPASLSWSPLGSGTDAGPLLAVSDSTGWAAVYALPPTRASNLAEEIAEPLASLGEGKRKKRKVAEGRARAAPAYVSFSSSVLPESSALLCIGRALQLTFYRVTGSLKECELIGQLEIGEPGTPHMVSSIAVSSLHPATKAYRFTLALGTGSGMLRVWRFKLLDGEECGLKKEGEATLFHEADAEVRNLAIAEADEAMVVGASRGSDVLAVLFRQAAGSTGWAGRRFKSSVPGHALPIIGMQIDVLGALAGRNAGEDVVSEARLITMDAEGWMAMWRLSGLGPSEPRLLLCRAGSGAPAAVHEWLTPLEQVTQAGEVKSLSKHAVSASIAYNGLSFSPNSCLLGMQAVGRPNTMHSTSIRLLMTVTVAPTVTPVEGMPVLLRALLRLLRRHRAGEPIVFSCWDFVALWSAAWDNLKEKAAWTLPSELLQKWRKEPQVMQPKTLMEMLRFLWTILQHRETAQSRGGWNVSDDVQTQQEQEMLKLEREVAACSDDLAICRLRNCVREILRRLMAFMAQRRTPGVSEFMVVPSYDSDPFDAAAAEEYWRLRSAVAEDLPWSGEDVSAFLAAATANARSPGQKQPPKLVSPCRVCGDPAKPDLGLLSISCGKHSLPLCQLSLTPILSERHTVCGLCKRTTGRPSGKEREAPSCAWCAAASAPIL